VLAGRDPTKIEPLARELGCPFRVFPLSPAKDLARHLDGIAAVLHCAGPFTETAEPMMQACLAARAHYLDITGEIEVIELAHSLHDRAQAAGISLLPAVGMDVVPSDCLAARLSEAVPNAMHLELAFAAEMSLSPGTAKTAWKHLGEGGRIRQDGRIARVRAVWKVQQIPFDSGSRWAMTIPWGDVASAYYTTGIPNIEVYTVVAKRTLQAIRRWRWLAPLANFAPIQWAGRRWIDRRIHGPGEAERNRERTEFWGRTTAADGRTAEATLQTPNGYALTVQTSLAALEQVLQGQTQAGFSTPARAFGPQFIEQFDGVSFGWRTGKPTTPT
jgi:short subunit dehydrogenase-like uncharacterized protein